MQLANSFDLSSYKNGKKGLLKAVFSAVKFTVVTLLFYAFFSVLALLKVFGQSLIIPDTFLALIFTVLEVISIILATIKLTGALYKSQDVKFLLTMPVKHNAVFFSKLILFFIYEIIKNVNFTLPLFVAYGLFNGAVWFYYLWLLICFVLISLIPVSIGAVLSVLWLYLSNFISKYKVLQAVIIVTAGLLIAQILFKFVSLIPENINILAQWNNITQNVIAPFLNNFASTFKPFYNLTLMTVGSALLISSNVFNTFTLSCFFISVFAVVLCFFLCNAVVKPLFFKMASKQFEYEKNNAKAKQNVVYNKYFSPFIEELTKNFRSSKYIAYVMLQILLPAMLVFLLNKLYLSMQTSFNGQFMTKAFNMLVLLLSILSFNNEFSAVFSKQGAIRNFNKTRPISASILCFSQIAPRLIISVISAFLGAYLYYFTSKVKITEFVCVFLICSFTSIAHLFWCAELDVMNPQTNIYSSLNAIENNPNENSATLYSLLISIIFAFLLYFLARTSAVTVFYKLLFIAVAFFLVRTLLFFMRVKLYYKEN